jgi:hypothetical protein
MDLPVIELANNGAVARRLAAVAAASRHRSVYLPLLRGLTPNSLAAFDFAEQGMVTGARDTTTVAPQALYLLNDPFVETQSRALAERLQRQEGLNDTQRIDLAYRLTLGRSATMRETGRAAKYVVEYAAAAKESLGAARTIKVAGKAPASKLNRSKNQKPSIRKVSQSVARTPKPETRSRADAAVDESPAHATDPTTAAWNSFCQALFSSAEFRYLK